MPDLPYIWGPVCWIIDPPTNEVVDKARTVHARKLGLANLAELDTAELMGNLAYEGDEAARVARDYIERDRTRRAAARDAAKAPRRGKWDAVRFEALGIADLMRTARPDLSRSRLAVLVMDRLDRDHSELPDLRTVRRWLQISGN